RVQSLTCPSCNSALNCEERLGTESLVCDQCRSIVAVTANRSRLIGRQGNLANYLARMAPLRLGTRGTLRGKTLEVIGVIERAEDDYCWYEIAAADENGDITWLWVDRGHFSLAVCEGAKCVSQTEAYEYTYQSQILQLFGRGKGEFKAAIGQFPFE